MRSRGCLPPSDPCCRFPLRRHPTPVARTWQATPALLSDVAHEPALRDAAMAAIDTQLSAELPL